MIKGRPRSLASEGQLRSQALRESHITRRDLESVLYLKHQTTELTHRLECSGDISLVLKEQPPQAVEISVTPGVQTIQIQLKK